MKILSASLRFFLLALFLACVAGCGDSSDDGDDGQIDISGKAFLPPQVSQSITISPVPNAEFIVIDLAKAGAPQIASGVTEADGSYKVSVSKSALIAIIVSGQVRVAGLVKADPATFEKRYSTGKNFNGITDMACEAGIGAVTDGSVTAEQITEERIGNLELASELVLTTGLIDFTNPDSVSEGAIAVRILTDDGAHPPELNEEDFAE